jgi:uncharacterized glyoxalase superfamily protein PhnB
MNPPPSGWPRLTASVFYDDAPAAIAWLVRAFGFDVRLKVEGDEGRIEYADVDAVCAQAVAAGATVVREPSTTDYGDDFWADRSCGLLDLEGHLWWFMQRVRGAAHAR